MRLAVRTILVCALAVVAAGCRSSDTSLTGPTGSKCSIALSYVGGVVGAQGGAASVAVTTARECTWAASSSAPWLTVGTPSGQGSGAVAVSFQENAATATRQGAVTVGDQTILFTQAAAAVVCQFAIAPQSASVDASAGTVTIAVTAQPGCAWTASTGTPWLSIAGGASGSGSGQVTLAVQSNTGAQRTGSATIASQTFAVTQAAAALVAPCSYVLSPASASIGSAGDTGTVSLATAATCSWTASSSVPWAAVTSATSGSGPAAVAYRVDANNGAARSGSLTIGGQTFTINQGSGAPGGAPSCSYTVAPSSRSFDQAGGTSSVTVTAPAGCSWSASASASWLHITGGSSGGGSGSVTFNADANPGAPRSSTLVVAGQSVQIDQAGCSYSLAPTSVTLGSGGGPGSVAVTAPSACAWSVSSADSWIAVTSGNTGTGTGTVTFLVAANTGAARTGALTIAGQPVTVSQAAAPVTCTYSVAPGSRSFPAAGGTASLDVSTGNTCTWSASASDTWVRIVGGQTGTGPGRVDLDVLPNTSVTARSATVTVAGQVVSVSQAGAACTYSVSPTSLPELPAAGTDQARSATVSVTAPGGCAWVASSGAPWIRVTPATGSGNGIVSIVLETNNSGARRSASVNIQGTSITVAQGP